MAAKGIGIYENQVYSSRVVRSEFDKNWKTTITRSGYVVYTAQKNRAQVTVLLTTGARKLITFNKGGQVIVGSGGVSHYSKPHWALDL
ncbi:hypothetical protein [Paenibacillus glycanilyticus]|uniref:Uncharacterized protein n=1 Tax=Paenibacillus glycanilyticus TaxID=126569 RepID=A0ABQ6GE75_9BACL|nr:hypothetical protein [Paenibacillus glycanilyticus]GLX68790.1 hypothetical protein MU1_31350 [Paenibacillus glycanilyticus]